MSLPEEGDAVKALFNNLSRLMRRYDVKGVGLSLHTRKRQQGASGRAFDDLFGSREWKGRLNTVLYFEGTKIMSWKNRGGQLHNRFKREAGKRPWAVLNRPGLTEADVAPFTISFPEDHQQQDGAEVEAKIFDILRGQPDHFTKSSLAAEAGGRKEDVLAVINRLQDQGVIGPKQTRGAKLKLLEDPLLRKEGESSQDGSL